MRKKINLQPENITLLILNDDSSNISRNKFLKVLIKQAKYIMVVDGGVNVFLRAIENNYIDKDVYHLGDFDSTDLNVLENYTAKFGNYKKIFSPDQDFNDYEKTLIYIQDNLEQFTESSDIFVYGLMGSRFDHTISNLCKTMQYNEKETLSKFNFFAVAEEYQVAFLRKGNYEIIVENYHEKDKGVGIMSLLGVIDNIVTDGLKWNINNDWPLGILEKQSTSNEIVKDYVTIDCDKSFIFSLQILHDLQ